ncbi:MAG: siderophore-interacting protein [Porticoccaceae bacterium]|jgi:NADPH-dependent ferric siderophore reductase|nr:siderophore-interacting protein [Porticoccaceae bacterium]
MADTRTRNQLPRQARVVGVRELSPNMRRVSLVGDDLEDFPEGQESGYVKLLLKHQGEEVRRSYTIRRFESQSKTLHLDFMRHADGGPASAWAESVEIGQEISLVGPGAKKLLDFDADWFLLAGDMTALPAISVNIEQLPKDAKGYVAIELLSEADKQDLPVPEGVELHWVVNERPNRDSFPLLDKVKEFEFLAGKPSMWVAGEFHTSRAIRRYLKLEKGVQRDELYASSYWHLGLSDDQHKVAKQSDTD